VRRVGLYNSAILQMSPDCKAFFTKKHYIEQKPFKMKKIIIYILTAVLVLTSIAINAQVVETDPEYPLPDGSITITYHANLGNGALAGYNGDIYAHTGVITSQSTSPSDWKYVKTDWAENTAETQLTNISGDTWQLVITPDIRSYYGVPASETIEQLAFVFRNEDGSIVGRGDDGGDIFINVFNNPYDITWNSPDTLAIYSVGDEIEINAVVLAATEMAIDLNGVNVATNPSNNISYTFEADQTGTNTVTLQVTGTDTTFSDEISFYVRTETQIAELPSTGLKDGINYIDDNTVTLVLFAPYKDFVFVKGSFNDWNIGEENQMFRTPDNNRYWVTLENLVAGQEYAFQYIVDGEITIADPYADKILDPWNDQYIPESTYPNLMDYPIGKADGIVSVFQTAQIEYQWQVEEFEKPFKRDLVVYELLVRDFIESRNYQTLIDTISYLKNLGVNAIELMPVSEFEGNSSWGYNPSFYFAPDKYYGTRNDLKEFIDVCHQNGMAVILDMVLNHSYGQSPLVQLYFDGSAGEYGQPTPENPWYNEVSPNQSYYWGFDFNHESPHTKEFVSRVVKYWLEEYKFDGYRFDFTKGFTNTPGDGWPYDQARIDILKEIYDTIDNTSPGAYVILEHLTDNSEEKVLANYGMMLWGNMNHSYLQSSMGYTDGSDFSGISYKSRGWSQPHLVGYMESHDEERMMFKNLSWGNGNGAYQITNIETALRRAELSTLFFLTVPGPKMIWQFGETGYDYSIDYDCRVCEKPVRWDYMDEAARKHLYKFYGEIASLRNTYPIFGTDNFNISAHGEIKQITFNYANTAAVLIGNFDVVARDYKPNLSESETWYSYFEGNQLISNDTTFTLHPGQYKLLINEEYGTPQFPAFPEVSQLSIWGDAKVNDTLHGIYTYFDLNGDIEGNSIYQWYRSDDSLGTNKTLIEGAQSAYYLPTSDDLDKYLSIAIKPVSSTSIYLEGQPAESKLVGPVLAGGSGSGINIYPVPSQNEIKIDNASKFEKIVLLNTAGQPLQTWDNHEYSLTINIEGLRTGVYLLKFEDGNTIKTKRIVKIP
jgi:glycosidase